MSLASMPTLARSRTIAAPEAMVSRHPRFPQEHMRSAAASTLVWVMSPEA